MKVEEKKIFIYSIIIVFFTLISTGRNMVWSHDIPLWSDIVYKSGNKIRPRNALGLSYMRGGFFEESLREFNVSLSLNPNYIKTHNNLGVLYYAMENFSSAEREFRAILKLFPNNQKARFNLAVLLYKNLDRYGESEKLLLKILENPSLNPRYYFTLGDVYRVMGEFDMAKSYYNKALKIDSHHIDSIKGLKSLTN